MSEQLIATPGVFGENGNFLLERELGRGGMGGVYMGRDKMLDRPVAVKVMLKEYGSDPGFVEKFKREAQAAAKLIHPNIAQIYSYGICDGMPYIAMELAAGGSLWTIMKAAPGKTDVVRVMKICQQVAQALQCSSDQGYVHGDIKPENILLDANGNAKLVDFGLAGMQKDTNEIWGTPYYIAPEKVRQEPIDFRADMYNLGGTLYHALTGVAPFEGEDVDAVVRARFVMTPKKPSEVREGLSPLIDSLVMRMLAHNRDDRFPSFEALIEEIRNVLTNGLGATSTSSLTPVVRPAEAEKKAEGEEAKSAAGGSAQKKVIIRGGRRMMVRRKMVAKSSVAEDEEKPAEAEEAENEGGEENAEEEGGGKPKGKLKLKRNKKLPKHKPSSEDDYDDEDEEEGGNLGAKVMGVIFGAILLIGGVIGGLVWYQVHDKQVRAEEKQAQIVGNINKARQAIADTRATAGKYAVEFADFAKHATEECKKHTEEVKRNLPMWETWKDEVEPPPTKELLDAIASTNEVQAAASTNAVPAAAGAGTNAVAAVAGAKTNAVPAAAAGAKPKKMSLAARAKLCGLPPPPEDFDPVSPEGEEYLAKLKAAEKALAEKAEAAKKEAEKPKEEPKPAAAPAEPEKKTEELKRPPELDDLHGIWERAYSCQASVVRIQHKIRKVLAECDSAAEIKGETEEAMTKLGELSRKVVEMLEEVKVSKDVENVRKGITFIKQKGANTVKKLTIRLRKERLEKERKQKEEEEKKREEERLKKLAEEKQKLIEKESNDAKERFDNAIANGTIRLLDWKGAIRQLETIRADIKTAEGGMALDMQERKVKAMQYTQTLFVKNLKDYTFRKSKLKHCKVLEVNDSQITYQRPNVKSPQKLTWTKFYKEYHVNLNELIIEYVERGRKNCKPQLNLKEWAEAMSGAALSMRIICSDEPSAATRAEGIARKVATAFQDFVPVLKVFFPDIDFDAEPESAEKKDAKTDEKADEKTDEKAEEKSEEKADKPADKAS